MDSWLKKCLICDSHINIASKSQQEKHERSQRHQNALNELEELLREIKYILKTKYKV